MNVRRYPVQNDPEFADRTWGLLRTAIIEILNQNNSGLSFEELYRNAYAMVLHKHGDHLYNGLKHELSIHLQTIVLPKIKEAFNDSFLDTLNKAWSNFTLAMVMIRDILMYMDRVYIGTAKVDDIYTTGIKIFRRVIIEESVIGTSLPQVLLHIITKERQNEMVDRSALKNACKMLLNMGDNPNYRSFYQEMFEKRFLGETRVYYESLSQKMLACNSATSYVTKVQQILSREGEFADIYMDTETQIQLSNDLKFVLVSSHLKSIIEMEDSGMLFLLKNNKLQDLENMYNLIKGVPTGTSNMIACISEYVKETGSNFMRSFDLVDPSSPGSLTPMKLIDSLMGLRDRCDAFLEQSFSNDDEIKKNLQEDFEYFLNLSKKTPEYLSLFIDEQMKKNIRERSHEIESIFDKSMILFRYLEEKDMFENYYRRHLSKRLLNSKTLPDELEHSMVARIKTQCGGIFTSKMDGMFKDIETSEDVQIDFKSHCHEIPQKSNIDLFIRVMKPINWPSPAPIENIMIGPELESVFEHFSNYYKQKYQNKILKVHYGLGTAELKATFYGKNANESQPESGLSESPRRGENKVLIVSTIHMLMLLQFNDHHTRSYSELQAATNIPDKDLKRVLQSVAIGKSAQRILVRTVGSGKDILGTDEFIVNDQFTSKYVKIKITNVSGKFENEPERKKTKEGIDNDRKGEIDAAIVRVMKARKSLDHNNLISEVTDVLKVRFKLEISVVKRCIENLIEREFIKRSESNKKTYEYIT
uniref:CULLIN_2 domain-containing protein n=1 Tax=Rhabditophanes sp. KR3021 TaxID=114890 RepID=A0AC35UAM8_9BILA